MMSALRRGRRGGPLAAVMAMLSAFPGAALACPDCRLGVEVRRRVMDEAFWSHLAVMLLPFVVVGLVAAWLHQIGAASAQSERRSS